jgi:hypothetical protein
VELVYVFGVWLCEATMMVELKHIIERAFVVLAFAFLFFIMIYGFVFWLVNPELSQMELFLKCYGLCG